MKYLFMFLFLPLIILELSLPAFVLAQSIASTAGSSAVIKEVASSHFTPIPDYRRFKLVSFLQSYNSPLVELADEFIDIADKYALDWKLIPSISGVESTFGKRYPTYSNNPFGWGIYQDQVLVFKSIPEAAEAVATGIVTKYPASSRTNINRLGRIYNGVTPESWSSKVQYFMDKLENQQPTSAHLQLTL